METIPPPKLVGKHIAQWRKLRGLKQRQLAVLVGYEDGSGLSEVERGEHYPGFDKALGIAAVLRGSLDTFVLGPPTEKTILEKELLYVVPQMPEQVQLGLLIAVNHILSKPYTRQELHRLVGMITDIILGT